MKKEKKERKQVLKMSFALGKLCKQNVTLF
jgi:hypothetical protein